METTTTWPVPDRSHRHPIRKGTTLHWFSIKPADVHTQHPLMDGAVFLGQSTWERRERGGQAVIGQ